MRKQFGSMLLRGAMMMLAALPLAAQQQPSATGAQAVKLPLEVAFTYNAVRAKTVGGTNFWMQGAGMQIEGRVTPNFGVVADVAGEQINAIGSTGVGLDLVTATFGPRLTLERGRYSVYGQALAGEGIGFNSVFTSATGATSSSYNLALKMGGGMNVALTQRLAVRLLEADWLRTELPNSGGNVQNDLTLGAGVVFRFR